jgi:small subunit ribosomal protein S16
MTKFQAWHEEHESNIKRRNDSHRSQQRERRAYVPPVRKVVEETSAPAAEGSTEA